MQRNIKYKIFYFLFFFFDISVACTIGAFSSISTQSQKPLLWKNRDISNPNQAVYFFTDGRYPYLCLVYADDRSNVWAGINEKGFAIINSNSYNIGAGAPSGFTDGELMKHALQNYASIEEFENFLDSTNLTGRRTPSNFAVMDSTGEATVFETSANNYDRFDASEESLGFMIRANFSLIGDSTRMTGYERYVRGSELARAGYQQGVLDAQYIFEKIARDLGGPGFNPYPLPFRDTVGSYPFGFLPTSTPINRNRTRACIVIVGRRPYDSDKLYRMMTILGEPCVGIALPIFLSANRVPEPISGPGLPQICASAKSLRDFVYMGSNFGLNTFLLVSVYEQFLPLEAEIFNITQEQLGSWYNYQPTASEIFGFEESLAQQVVAAYEQFNWNKNESYRIDLPGIIISPNPARNPIKINIDPELSSTSIKVYNILGKKVDELFVTPELKMFYWSPEHLSSGIYFLIAEPNRQAKVKFQFIRS
jgi:hypothetical protein